MLVDRVPWDATVPGVDHSTRTDPQIPFCVSIRQLKSGVAALGLLGLSKPPRRRYMPYKNNSSNIFRYTQRCRKVH